MNQSYYRNVNPDLLDRIPLNAQTVVEVGCGSGALGSAYKLRNPQVHYIGVEAMAGLTSFIRLIRCWEIATGWWVVHGWEVPRLRRQ